MYTHYDDLKDQGWNAYINTIARRLLQADTSNESFAVGITGEWGSGKSTFLRLMKKRFEQEKCILIEFNPWRCTNSSMIIHDYFETLKEKLIPYYSDLEKPLTRYAETLVELELDNTVTKYAQKIVDREDTGLKSLQENIDACLVKMDLPVIIYIDDLDRLDKDELFEVLRLIRNTAQFKRLVYVVTYDKKHIVSLLKSKNIDSAELYIRKIFSMEISLPNYESDLLPQLLYEEIRRLTEGQLPNDMWPLISEQIFKQQENRYLIVEYLQTFRDIKRLAHSFAVNVESVFKLLYPIKEISIVDFFWLEVIHYADYDLYKMLKRESQQVFIIKSIKEKEGLLCYELTENYCLHRILHILYAKERLNDKDSIKYVVNHPKYFSFRLQKQQISKESYRMALNRESNFFTLEEWIKSQVNSNMVDRSQSLYFLLDKTDTQNLDIHISKRYIDLILYWLQYGTYNQIPILVSRKLKKECYNKEFHKLLASHAAERLETVIDQAKEDSTYYHISQALTFMYTSEIELEGNTQFSNDHLLSNEEIEAFHQRNIISYLQHAVILIEDMVNIKRPFYHLVRSAVVLVNNNQDTGYKLKKNLVIDFIIEHYRHNYAENDYRPFLKEFDSKTSSGDSPYLANQMKSETKVKIEHTFGTLDKYKEFLEQCFLIPRNIRSNYYKKNNL